MMLMPTGMSAAAKPWSALAVMTKARVVPSAPITDPMICIVRQKNITLRLPYISARRETIGVATAEVSRVAVTSQDALSAVVSSRRGSSGSTGMMSVCCSATTVPVSASTVVRTAGLRLRPPWAAAWVGVWRPRAVEGGVRLGWSEVGADKWGRLQRT